MRVAVITAMIFAFSCNPLLAQESSRSGFWKGKLEIYQFNFSIATGVEDKNLVSRNVELWRNQYDLYQNPEGMAREELTQQSQVGNTSIEAPHDIRLLDYNRSYGLSFDRLGKHAMGGPLAPVPGKVIAQRRILGFVCDGKEYQWTTFQHATVQLKSWSARDSDFKVPLLEVEYFTDDTGALLAMTVQVVSKLEAISELPAALFQAPRRAACC